LNFAKKVIKKKKIFFSVKLQKDDVGVNEMCFTLKCSNVTRQIILRTVVLKYQSCLILM